MAKNLEKTRTVYLHSKTYHTQAEYIASLARLRGITSAANMLAIIIDEHKTLTELKGKER